jgi:drug/metabolite transporter (DMT)-like permease
MLLGMFAFGTMDALVKGLVPSLGVGPVLWSRYAGQTLLVIVVLAPRLGEYARSRRPGLQFARSAFQFGSTLCFFSGLMFIGLAEAAAIMNINPVLITLMAALVLRERLGPRRLAGIAAALVGALIVIRPGSGVFSFAALLPLFAAIFYTGYAIVTRIASRSEGTGTSMLYSAAVGTVVSTLALPLYWVTPSAGEALRLVAVALLGSAGQLFVIRAFTIAEASLMAPFAYATLLIATFWGITLYGEWPDLATVAGGLVIVGAGLYVWHRETRVLARTAE